VLASPRYECAGLAFDRAGSGNERAGAVFSPAEDETAKTAHGKTGSEEVRKLGKNKY